MVTLLIGVVLIVGWIVAISTFSLSWPIHAVGLVGLISFVTGISIWKNRDKDISKGRVSSILAAKYEDPDVMANDASRLRYAREQNHSNDHSGNAA